MKKMRGLGRIKKGSQASERGHKAILSYIAERKGHLIGNRRLHQVYIFGAEERIRIIAGVA